MTFSIEEIQEFGLRQLTSLELEEAFEAFNGFGSLFGRDWLESPYRGMQSAWLVRWVITLWRDWRTISNLPKSEKLIERWRSGLNEGGVITEVRVFANVARAGAELELFPEVNKHVPDCRFRTSLSDSWVYIEASARSLSQIRHYGLQILNRVSTAAADAVPGMHGKVAILRTPSFEETDRIMTWLYEYPKAGNRLEDLAEFYADTIESPSGPDDFLEERVPKPALSCAYIASSESLKKKGTARLGITDTGADQALKTEAEQLPHDEVGVVVLDVSQVVGGHREWASFIQRRFQPSLHTRVSAVILMQSSLTEKGSAITGQVLLNPYAKRSVPSNVLSVLESFIQESDVTPTNPARP